MKYYVSLTGAQPEHQTGKWEVSACVLTLGRGDSADIKLPDSGRVISRQQGRLQLGADARPTWYQDGANPSLINGQPVCMLQHRALQAGDRIQVGHYELCIETDCHAAPHALSFHTGSAWPGLGEAACLSIDDLLSEPAHQQPAPHTGAQVHQSSGFFEVLGHRHDIPFLELQHGTQAEWQQAGLSGQEHPQAHAEPRTDVQSALIPLLEGMGLPADTPLNPVQLHAVGRYLKDAIDGTVKLMAIRNLFKQETRSELTQIIQTRDNPLKHSVCGEQALQRLLEHANTASSFQPCPVQSSFNDLLAHQRGLVSGLHSAMGALEKELAPETIQAAPRSWLQWPRLLRAALSWKNYQRTYDRLFRRGGGLFDTLLGEHLREAFARESARVAPPRAQPRTAAEPHQKPEEKRA